MSSESNSSSNNSLDSTPPVNESFSSKILATLRSFKLFKLITIVCVVYVLGGASSERCLFALAAPVSSNLHIANNHTNYLLNQINSNKLAGRKPDKFSAKSTAALVKSTTATTTPKADEYDYYEEETNEEANKKTVNYGKTVEGASLKATQNELEHDDEYEEEYEVEDRIVSEESSKHEKTSTIRTTQSVAPSKMRTGSQTTSTKKAEKSSKEMRDEDYDYGEEDYYILSNRYFQMGKNKKAKTTTATLTQTSSGKNQQETISSTKEITTKPSSSPSTTISSQQKEELVAELKQARTTSTKSSTKDVELISTTVSIEKPSIKSVVQLSKNRIKPDKVEAVEFSGANLSTSADTTLSTTTAANSTASTNKTTNEDEYYLEDEYYEDEYSDDYKEDEQNAAPKKVESTRKDALPSGKSEEEGGEEEYKDTEEYYYDEDDEKAQQPDTTEGEANIKAPSDVQVDETFDEYDENVGQTSTKSAINKVISLVPELKLNKIESEKMNRFDEVSVVSSTTKSSTLVSSASTVSSQSSTKIASVLTSASTTNANKKIIDRINQNKEINLADNIDNYLSEENLDSEQTNEEDDDVEIDEYDDQMSKNFEQEQADETDNQDEELIHKSKIDNTSIINTKSILRYLTLKELLKSPALLAGVFGGLLVGVITASLLLFFIIYKMRRRKYDDNTYIINGTMKSSNFHYGNSRGYRHANKHVTLLSSSSISPTANLSAGSSASATTGLLNGHTMNNSRILKYTNTNNTLRKASSVLSSDSSSSPNHESSLNYAYIKAPTKEFYA